MCDFALKRWVVVMSLLLLPGIASAAGLGRLNVLSAIGQPFNAEIDLVSVEKEDPASLSVRLASPEDYRKANLQFSPVVAALRLSIEKRPNGQPYIRITSMRPVNEFVVDLLVELSWPSGRILREYRALLDPPVVEPVAAPVSVPEPKPVPAPAPATRAPVVSPPAPAPAPGSYGPVGRGETLSKIARSVMPEGVTLEQMLVGLYRANPDAFIRNNMNLVRTGKILRVPDKEQVTAIPREEALQEYRAQVADWNSYRRRVADTAAATREAVTAAKGQIAARVDDKAGREAKDVVRLSKGEPPGTRPGEKPASPADRIRSLEEELVAREKALAEANDRIAQLEKTIKDMQRLMEIKSAGLAAAQQQVEAVKPQAKPELKPEAKPEAKAATEAQQPKPKPAPKPQAPPPQPREPELMDIVMDNLPLVGGGAAIVLGGLGLWLARRRRVREIEEPGEEVRAAPTMVAAAPDVTPAAGVAATVKPQVEAADLDPLEEARVYLLHGREAQAEATLKEAMAREPSRQDIQVKLLEIYALRKDKAAFNRLAADFNRITGGVGDNWLKVAAMGLALDPENPLFGAAKTEPATTPQSVDLDFDLDLSPPAEKPAAAETKPAEEPISKAAARDSGLDTPAAAEKKPEPEPDLHVIDFQIELPKIGESGVRSDESTAAASRQTGAPDFKLDLSDINLNLEEKPVEGSGPAKDAHWYDVQAKFDLARTYQEMGDTREARHVLEEVLREGDVQQQALARALLRELG